MTEYFTNLIIFYYFNIIPLTKLNVSGKLRASLEPSGVELAEFASFFREKHGHNDKLFSMIGRKLEWT